VTRLRPAGAALLAAAALLASACVSVTNPEGWAPPVLDGTALYLTTDHGHVVRTTLGSDGRSAAAAWTFPDKNIKAEEKLRPNAAYGRPILADGRVYYATFEAGVFALNAETGRPEWPEAGKTNASAIKGNIAGGLAYASGILFFGTTEGRLYGWNAANGAPAPGWETPLVFDSGIWATPVALGGTLYVATMNGELHAIRISDRSPAWPQPLKISGAIPDLVALDDARLFVPSINRHVYIVEAATGRVLTDFRAKDWVWTAPALDGNRLFFGDFGGHIYGLDISTSPATELWPPASTEGHRVKAGPVIVDDVLVVADRGPVVTFINSRTGEVLNRVPIDGAGTVRANLLAANGGAYILTTKARLFFANPANRSVVEVPVSGVKR
jgi:outer membrane protein assembly factor BamB